MIDSNIKVVILYLHLFIVFNLKEQYFSLKIKDSILPVRCSISSLYIDVLFPSKFNKYLSFSEMIWGYFNAMRANIKI